LLREPRRDPLRRRRAGRLVLRALRPGSKKSEHAAPHPPRAGGTAPGAPQKSTFAQPIAAKDSCLAPFWPSFAAAARGRRASETPTDTRRRRGSDASALLLAFREADVRALPRFARKVCRATS